MYIRVAQTLNLTNVNEIYPFRKTRRGLHVMNDVAFGRFLKTLERTHEALRTGSDLQAALSFFTDNFARRAAQEIIFQVGSDNFGSLPWRDIESSLLAYRRGEEISEEAPSERPLPQAEEKEEEKKVLPSLIEEGEFSGLTPEQAEIVQRYKAKDYLARDMNQVNKMIERLISSYRKYNDPSSSEMSKNVAMTAGVKMAMTFLDNLHQNFLQAGDENYEETEEVIRDEEEVVEEEVVEEEVAEEEFDEELEEEGEEETSKERVIGDDETGISSVETDLRETRLEKTYPSDLSDEEALERVGLDAAQDYFSIENGELIIHDDAFNAAYEKTKNLFKRWADNAIQMKNGNRFPPPSDEVKRDLNIIVHGVRTFDFHIYNKFLEFIIEIDKEIKEREMKGIDHNLLALKQKLLLQRRNRLEPALISYRLSHDSGFAESIASALLYVASFNAFRNYTHTEEIFIFSRKSPLSPYIKDDPEAAQLFIKSLQRRSVSGVVSSFMKFWRLETRPLDPDTSRDILSFMNISAKLYFTGAVSETNNTKKGVTTLNTTNCPTCHKVIEFHTGAGFKEYEKDYAGFDLGVYVPYIKKDVNRIALLTESDLKFDDGRERYFPPPGKDYVVQNKPGQITLEAINNMDPSPRTWDEINQMVNSSDYEVQKEGLLRRSEALRLSGATYLKTVNINSIKYLCPMGKHRSEVDTNICGLNVKAPENATRAYHLQPAWNGEIPNVVNKDNKYLKEYKNSYFKPKDWKNEELAQIAESKGLGGYKFSRTMFGCPCHISDVDPDDDTIHLKYNNVAFRLKDDFHPPTNPDGSLSDISKDTYAYLVCSANVSLTSVDRDPSSPTFVLKHLSAIKNKQPELFINLLEFLIGNGFDEVDLLQMIEDIDNSSIVSQATDLSKRINARISKLEEILRKNAVNIGLTKTMQVIKDLTLICPFGHKFTIEQSLKFGGSHGSFKLANSKSVKQVSGILYTQGRENLENFKGFLVPYDEMSTQKAVYYDEWIKYPRTKRKINTWKQMSSDLVFLKFNIDGKDYVFSNNIAIRQDAIWSDSASRKFDAGLTSRVIVNEGLGQAYFHSAGWKIQGEVLENIGEKAAESASSYEESRTEWEAVMSQILDYNIEEEGHRFSPPIPGGYKTYNQSTNLVVNMDALNRSLYAAFNIINSWTSSLIHGNFEKTLARKYLEDEQLREIARLVFDNYLAKVIDFEIFDEDDDSVDSDINAALKTLKDFFERIFIDNAQIISLIRKEDLDQESVARKIIKESISDFIAKYENISFSSENLVLGEGLENVTEQDINQAVNNIIRQPVGEPKTRFQKSELVFQKITINDEKDNVYIQSVGKLTLIAYARFIANAIFKMQNLFFIKSSPLYVGYNPLPNHYDSIEDILRISKEDVEKLNISWGTVGAVIQSDQTVYESVGDIEAFGPKYLLMINKAYHYLDMHVKNARHLVITPKSLEAAKNFVQEELGDKYLAEYLNENKNATIEEAREEVKYKQDLITRALPIYNASFKDLVGNTEILTITDSNGNPKNIKKYSPFNVFPYFPISKRKTSGEFKHPFYDELEVKIDEKSGRKILVNPERGYNSGKLQVGFLTRPTSRGWPLPKFGYFGDGGSGDRTTTKNHVGLPIPFVGNYHDTNIAELRDMLLFNLKPVVEIPTAIPNDEENSATVSNLKVDISFLLERGYTKEHYRMIYNLYDELSRIKQILKNEEERISNIKNTHPEIIRDLERDIDNKNRAIRRNENRAGYKNKVINDKRDLESLLAKKERYVNELNNIDTLKAKLKAWYEKNLARIQSDFAELPINVNTKKDLYYFNAGADNLEEGMFKNQKAKLAKTKPAGVLHVGLADPILAYNLINNPEFHGQKYVNIGKEKIADEEVVVKNALIDFIVGVYNLDEMARLFVKVNANALTQDHYDLTSFSGRDLLKGTAEGVFSKEEYKSVSYKNVEFMPGNWYDISLEDSSISTYADTDMLEKGEPPTYKELISATSRAKHQGLSRPFEDKTASKNLITISYRAADSMSRYIRVVTQGTLPESEESEARDMKISESSRYLKNIFKRAVSLQRIMIMRAYSMIDPANLL